MSSLRSNHEIVDWAGPREMDCEMVWNAFFLYALLLDHHGREDILRIPHHAATQADRLRPALEARSNRMVGPGQEHWSHACDKCTWFTTADDGNLRKSVSGFLVCS